MEIGAGWIRDKKDRDGNVVMDAAGKPIKQLSVQLDIPFLGKINFTLGRITEAKTNQNAPDYKAYWFPPRDKPQASAQASAGGGYDDEGPGF